MATEAQRTRWRDRKRRQRARDRANPDGGLQSRLADLIAANWWHVWDCLPGRCERLGCPGPNGSAPDRCPCPNPGEPIANTAECHEVARGWLLGLRTDPDGYAFVERWIEEIRKQRDRGRPWQWGSDGRGKWDRPNPWDRNGG